MLLVARRAALAAAATGRGAVWSRPVAVTVKRWLTAPPLPVGNPPRAAAVAERRPAGSAAFSTAADNEARWSSVILPALEAFAQVHGHCLVPQSFVVPPTSPWPTDAWRVRLGMCVSSMRSRGAFSSQTQRDAARLVAIDFVWDVNEYKWTERILPALTAFATKFGHCDVPRSFIVPSDPTWPRKAWQLKLGNCVQNIRVHKGYYAALAERDAARLEAIDFVWRWDEYQWTRRILPSLEVFHRVEGHSNVPIGFVVPSESPWPESAWGLKLGNVIVAIRRRTTYSKLVDRDAGRLMELGFTVQPKGPHTGK
jgi:hypothetical protein